MPNTLLSYNEATEKLSLAQKVGQLFMPAVFINDTEEEITRIEHLLKTNAIGAICFFHSRASAATNFEGKKKVVYNENSYNRFKDLIARYQKASEIPLLIAIDAEWGLAMRIENTPQYPYAITLAAVRDNNDLVFEVGKHIAMDCKEAEVHWNLAPVVDVNNNPENPVIGYRSFGDDKNNVLSSAKAYLNGMKSVGILGAIKHFPGHGDTNTDSHLGLPIIHKSKENLSKNELYPYQQLIKDGVDAVMVGHLAVPELDSSNQPATTSSKIITDLLRTEMGFDGVIISDALNMHAVSKDFPEKGKLEATAFEAGMDVMCFSEHAAEGIQKILESSSPNRIEESFKRVWRLKEHAYLNLKNSDIKPHLSPSDLNRRIAVNAITQLYGNTAEVENIKNPHFLNLAIENRSKNVFSNKIGKNYYQLSLDNLDEVRLKALEHDTVVLALFPPSIKPKDHFGFPQKLLDFIKVLIAQKSVLLYLFGNPYVLDVLDLKSHSNAVIVYQDFPEFQEEAYHHFINKIEAKGKLPIKLKTVQL